MSTARGDTTAKEQKTGSENAQKRKFKAVFSQTVAPTPHQNHRNKPPKISRNFKLLSANSIKLRARRLTWCLISLFGAVFSLLPFLTLHLNQRVGLLIFESDLVQLRASLFSVILVLLLLSILFATLVLLANRSAAVRRNHSAIQSPQCNLFRSLLVQRILIYSIVVAAILSVLFYSSLALIVPQVRQLQRMPIATFDCNANQIVIENCHQQFSLYQSDEAAPLSIFTTIRQLFASDLSNANNSERLLNKLNCLKYSQRNFEALKVPTRFLLYNCGLVCRPHRQQFHQFGDDLNSDNQIQAQQSSASASIAQGSSRRLIAPYTRQEVHSPEPSAGSSSVAFVSLKVCFLGEIGDGSNYKRFCIENLANNGRLEQSWAGHQALTVGQLNALLNNRATVSTTSSSTSSTGGHEQDGRDDQLVGTRSNHKREFFAALDNDSPAELATPSYKSVAYQSQDNTLTTHYVNPVVQFESHFKNWPHLSSRQPQQSSEQHQHTLDNDNSWCKFKPIPPFIVNNKPFSDIQCSLEHEYTMSTATSTITASVPPNQEARPSTETEQIYFSKRPSADELVAGGDRYVPESSILKERCNIQCKVNILYKVHVSASAEPTGAKQQFRAPPTSTYYLPIKPCLIVSGGGDKARTTNYYLVFRLLADSSLFVCFLLFDLLLLMESVDTKQFPLESNKLRLTCLLASIALVPLAVAALVELASVWLPDLVYTSREGYLSTLFSELASYEHLKSALFESFRPEESSTRSGAPESRGKLLVTEQSGTNLERNISHDEKASISNARLKEQQESLQPMRVDHYLVPFLFYATFMFAFALNAARLPLVASDSVPLARVASTEELGLAQANSNRSQPESGGRPPETNSKLPAPSHSSKEPGFSQNNSYAAWKVASFAVLTLFMGLQFNLSQLTQTQIMIETFDLAPPSTIASTMPTSRQQGQQPQLRTNGHQRSTGMLWFIMVTHSGSLVVICVLFLFLSEELSAFLASFSPFRPVDFRDWLERQRSLANFQQYLSISLLGYSLRCFVLANMTQNSSAKWLLLVLFQACELLTFPLTWFLLTARAHELIARHPNFGMPMDQQDEQPAVASSSMPARSRNGSELQPNDRATSTADAFNGHLIVQSMLGLIYFAMGRLLALFVHSLHASLHLHSDNLDWFIKSFPSSTGKQPEASIKGRELHQNESLIGNEAFFAPLPNERQNYLHASRLLVKYNTLVCFIFGLVVCMALASSKYRIWREQRRRAKLEQQLVARQTDSDDRSDLIDERLGLDLMLLHSEQVRKAQDRQRQTGRDITAVIPPRPRGAKMGEREQNQRARIHFRYRLEGYKGSASSSSSSSVSSPTVPGDSVEQSAQSRRVTSKPDTKLVKGLQTRREQLPSNAEQSDQVEHVSRLRKKRVRIIEDGEVWPPDEQQTSLYGQDTGRGVDSCANRGLRLTEEEILAMAASPPPPQFADFQPTDKDQSAFKEQLLTPACKWQLSAGTIAAGPSKGSGESQSTRRITFAPNATLMGARATDGRDAESLDNSIGDNNSERRIVKVAPRSGDRRAVTKSRISPDVRVDLQQSLGRVSGLDQRAIAARSQAIRCASPEPSIEDDGDTDNGAGDRR